MAVLFALMKAIRAHYRRVSEEFALADDAELVQPSNNHAVVLVSSLNLATMRALGYAKSDPTGPADRPDGQSRRRRYPGAAGRMGPP